MKLIDNKLFLEFGELVECGVSDGYLRKAKSSGTKCWHFVDDPDDKRKVLIGYEDLKDNYKKLVMERFGDPYDMVARQPILDMVINDFKANEFYKQYRYGANEYLPIRTVNAYTRAASWLNMLQSIQEDPAVIKKVLGLKDRPTFYNHVSSLVRNEINNWNSDKYNGLHLLTGKFPSSYSRLMGKVKEYKKEGYDCLIDPSYGNKNAAKIGKIEGAFDPEIQRQQIAVIRALSTKHNNLYAAQIANLANTLFAKNGWQTISRATVYNFLQANKAVLTPGRRGRRAYGSDIAMQVKRKAPTFPTYYFTLDGWTVELAYQDAERYDNRLVVVVVLDAFNKYPVGYAIGDRENADLIRQANRNALLHLKELFGDYYYPYQLQSDNYAIKNLTPFYQAVSHLHTPAAVGNAKSKIVEPYFKYLNDHYCRLMGNWTGHNINARKENQVNAEFLDMIKKTFPNKAGVIAQIEMIMAQERAKKVKDYVLRWNELPAEDKRVMNRMDWLMVFGEPVGRTNKITGEGLCKVIAGAEHVYDSFEPAFRANLHIDWQIIADREDLSQVLAISDDGKQRFVLDRKRELPMSIRESNADDHAYRSQISQFNKDREREIMDMYAEDAQTVRQVIENTPLSLDSFEESALKLMFTDKRGQQKEGLQDAKRLGKVQQKQIADQAQRADDDWMNMQHQYMQDKMDFNQYAD